MKNAKIEIRVTEELKKAFQQKARESHRSLSQFMIDSAVFTIAQSNEIVSRSSVH